jgi:hypothetical protein
LHSASFSGHHDLRINNGAAAIHGFVIDWLRSDPGEPVAPIRPHFRRVSVGAKQQQVGSIERFHLSTTGRTGRSKPLKMRNQSPPRNNNNKRNEGRISNSKYLQSSETRNIQSFFPE